MTFSDLSNRDLYKNAREGVVEVPSDDLRYILKVEGENAIEFLNTILTGKMYFLQPFMSQQTLILNEEGRILDIVQILHMEEFFLWVGSRTQVKKVNDQIQKIKGSRADFGSVDVSELKDYSLLGYEGPYSWRDVSELVGSEALGLRYQGILKFESGSGLSGICVRSGWIGEYGYRIIINAEDKTAVQALMNKHRDIPTVDPKLLSILCRETRSPVFGITIFEGDNLFEHDLRYMVDFNKTDLFYFNSMKENEAAQEYSIIGVEKITEYLGPVIEIESPEVGSVLDQFYSPKTQKHLGFVRVRSDICYPGVALKFPKYGFTFQTRSAPLIDVLSSTVSIE